MKVRVSKSASVHLHSQWKCSACGAENTAVQHVSAFGDFASTKKEARTHASEMSAAQNLANTLHSLNHEDVGRRFDKVDLSGKCVKCGNCEPWACFNKFWIDFLKFLLRAAMLFIGLLLLPLLIFGVGPVLMSNGAEIGTVFSELFDDLKVIVLGALVICWIGLTILDAFRKHKIRERIRQLPAASIPVFQPAKNNLASPPDPIAVTYSAPKQNPLEYTEEELQQMPTWKRVEIMKKKEQE